LCLFAGGSMLFEVSNKWGRAAEDIRHLFRDDAILFDVLDKVDHFSNKVGKWHLAQRVCCFSTTISYSATTNGGGLASSAKLR